MCGICGIFDWSGRPIDADGLERMISILRHRGPDGSGKMVAGNIGIGHRRLSIIDLEGGAQPISNEDGRLEVVFNGEIYNFIELREELRGYGHHFKTQSDTEVIVHAYEQWNADCVQRFNGMFAFALWDKQGQELFLARDHLGIKPLYYFQAGNRFVFASEIKALLLDAECPREVDTEALAELFTFRYVPSPKTLFKGILKLPPAHRLMVSKNGLKISGFWDWVPQVAQKFEEEELVRQYQSLLEDAVRLQLRSDVPLGLFLSSGIDSGALLAIMAQNCPGPVRTFTIGFEGGEKTNEVDDARKLARLFGAEHEVQILAAKDYIEYYKEYMWNLEEPVGNETAAAFYFVSRLTRKQVKVALTGQGADEPWAGYDRHLGAKISAYYSRAPRAITGPVAALMGRIPGRMEKLQRALGSLDEPDMLTRFAKIYSFFSADMKAQLFRGGLQAQLQADPYGAREALRALQARVAHLDPLTQMLFIDTRANLPDDLLMVADKTSMANSLEVRVPLLDRRLVEFIEGLPPTFKLRRLTAKYLHKKAVAKYLPHDIIYRKKKGFANPIEDWVRKAMRPYVEECLLSKSSAVADYFDQGYIGKILEWDRAGVGQYRRHIYLLLSFELWHRAFLRGQR